MITTQYKFVDKRTNNNFDLRPFTDLIFIAIQDVLEHDNFFLKTYKNGYEIQLENELKHGQKIAIGRKIAKIPQIGVVVREYFNKFGERTSGQIFKHHKTFRVKV